MSEEQANTRKTEGIMRSMWIICQIDDHRWLKAVFEKVSAVVEEMSGEVVKSSSMGDLVVTARFPHRRIKAVEKAVAAALSTMPVKRTIVAGQDPYILRPKTIALTMELYRRQDEVVGISASLD
jgi:hypothetical protein